MRKLIALTTADLLQTFSFRKYGFALLLIAATCILNYYIRYPLWLRGETFLFSFCWYSVLFLVFLFSGILIETGSLHIQKKSFHVLLITAALLFALKVTVPFSDLLPSLLSVSTKHILHQPASWAGGVLLMISCILFIHRFKEGNWDLYGTTKTQSLSSYTLFIVLMLPLLIWASLQTDFSVMYPRAKIIDETLGAAAIPIHYFVFETAYAADFISIELFFRGFLIAALGKFLGKQCILPIALFYFSIHLGKPMFEAISSFFGGMILGTISYYSKSIWGGWLVHVSIAMLMELFGYLF